MHKIFLIEKKMITTLVVSLIILNLVSLYFIIDFYSFGEVSAYLPDWEIKRCGPTRTLLVFFIASMFNLLFTSITLMSRLLDK